jgi:hypothetical protein
MEKRQMEKRSETMRRLAVLVDSLDSDTASQFLDNVPLGTAENIRQQVIDLGRVSRTEREQVLQQFLFAVNGVQESIAASRNTAGFSEERVRAVSPRSLVGTSMRFESKSSS